MGPVGHGHGLPFPESAEAEFEQPFRLFFQGGDAPDGGFVEPFADGLGGEVGGESVFVVALGGVFDDLSFFHFFVGGEGWHGSRRCSPSANKIPFPVEYGKDTKKDEDSGVDVAQAAPDCLG